MKKLLTSAFILTILLSAFVASGQVVLDTVSLISNESTATEFCFNNTKLMAGNSISDRYIVYYNSDTVFLNIFQSGSWTKKIAYKGSNIVSATMTFYEDTIWICWKQGPFIKAIFTPDKGYSWGDVFNVSPPGNVAAPSIYASNNGKIHFVWSTGSAADTIIYYNVYDKGAFLPNPIPLNNPLGQGQFPTVIAIGDTVLASWKEGQRPTKVWFRSSFEGGKAWNELSSTPTTTSLNSSKDPNLAYAYDSTTSTHYVYLAYDGQNMIYLQRSTDFGNSWSSPDIISSLNKWSQFAHIECNNKGFVGVSYEQRPIATSLYDDTKKDVGFAYSIDWGNSGTFSADTLAYTHNSFGSAYPAFNKIDENNFYLAWLTNDTINNKTNVLERLVHSGGVTGINTYEQSISPDISISPNPFSAQTILCIGVFSPNINLAIYNSYGQIVKQINNPTEQTIIFHRDDLPSGLYFVRLIKDGNIAAACKMIITN